MRIFIILCVFTALAFAAENELFDDYSPYEAAIEELGVNESILEECKVTHTDCITSAHSHSEGIQCFIQLGLCIGRKVSEAGCARKCVLPLIMCRISAGHSWHAILTCGKNFLHCALGGCKESPSVNSISFEDEFSPYELAVSTMDDNSVDITVCKAELGKCVSTTVGIVGKVKCFVKMGKCIGKELIGCSANCIAKFMLCKYEAGGHWIKTAICATNFLSCSINGCV